MAAQLEDDEQVLVSDFDDGGSLGRWQSACQCEGRARQHGHDRSEMGEAFLCPATHGDKLG
jgi:hypothetical protein